MTISHFSAVILFSLFISVVFGITQRAEPKMMIRFGAFCFVLLRRRHHRSKLAHVFHQALSCQLRRKTKPTLRGGLFQ